MSKFDKIIDNLINKEDNKKKFLSLYFPINDYTKKQAQKRISSLVEKGFKNNKSLNNLSNLHSKVADNLAQEFINLKAVNKGVGIFAEFFVDTKNKGKKTEIEDVEIVTFARSPKKKIFIGNIYDLDQLVWISNLEIDALVIDLHRKKCLIYLFEENDLELLTSIENEFIDFKEPETMYKPPILADKIFYSPGSNKVEKEKQKENRFFLNAILEEIQENKQLRQKFRYLLLFYSERYSEFVNGFSKHSGIKCSFKPITIKKHPGLQKKHKFEKIVLRKIRKYQKQKAKELFSLAKEDYLHYKEGWKDVLKAANKGKIEHLFIQPYVKKQGYFKNDLLYLNKQDKARKINNLGPWLVKSVIKKGGKIVIIKKDWFKEVPEVTAKLRF